MHAVCSACSESGPYRFLLCSDVVSKGEFGLRVRIILNLSCLVQLFGREVRVAKSLLSQF